MVETIQKLRAPTIRTGLPPGLGRVLVIMTDHHLGNAVVSMPVIAALAEYFTSGIDLLLDERHAPLFELIPRSERIRVLTYPASRGGRRGLARHLRPALVTLGLWTKRYRLVIDLSTGIRSTTISLATLSKIRLGFGDVRRSWSYSHKINAPSEARMLERYAQVLRFIGHTTPLMPIRLRAPHDAFERVGAALDEAFPTIRHNSSLPAVEESAVQPPGAARTGEGFRGVPLAVIHPSSGKAIRRWPAERFAAVADNLINEHGMWVCIIGVPSERELACAVIDRMARRDRACFLTLSLLELLALFDLASILVSNESGPTHLAATTEIPIVTIFGPTQESLWRPVRGKNLTLLRGAQCDPGCRKGRCVADLKCLNELQATRVIDAVREALDASLSDGGPEHQPRADLPLPHR